MLSRIIQLFDQFKTGQAGHFYISKNNIWIRIKDGVIGFQPVFAYAYHLDSKAFPVNQAAYGFSDYFFIIYNN